MDLGRCAGSRRTWGRGTTVIIYFMKESIFNLNQATVALWFIIHPLFLRKERKKKCLLPSSAPPLSTPFPVHHNPTSLRSWVHFAFTCNTMVTYLIVPGLFCLIACLLIPPSFQLMTDFCCFVL